LNQNIEAQKSFRSPAGALMNDQVIYSITLLAFASFTQGIASENSTSKLDDQAKAGVEKPVPADKPPQKLESTQSPAQPPAKPSMVDYCREHTC
jgi:hypothetical protein